jgi:ribonuclease T1
MVTTPVAACARLPEGCTFVRHSRYPCGSRIVKTARLVAFVVAAVVAVLASQRLGSPPDTQPLPAPQTEALSGEADASGAGAATVVRDVTVRDLDGRVAYRGDVDLAPALARIEAGERDAHRNDGGVFGNREGLLPRREQGYYREYVVRTPGITHAGPQRLVIGRGGDVWYTHDHYSSFTRVR